MYTVAEAVEELLRHSTLLEEGLEKGIINYSALAREMKPKISEKVMKEIETGAIVMALKRHADRLKKQLRAGNIFTKTPDITVRSNLVEYTFANSPTLSAAQYRFFTRVHTDSPAPFLIITQGIFETTLIVSETLSDHVQHYFSQERTVSAFTNLSGITIKLPTVTVTTPGVYGKILRALEWDGINVVEVASTYTEFTIILNDGDIDRAFATIKKALS